MVGSDGGGIQGTGRPLSHLLHGERDLHILQLFSLLVAQDRDREGGGNSCGSLQQYTHIVTSVQQCRSHTHNVDRGTKLCCYR